MSTDDENPYAPPSAELHDVTDGVTTSIDADMIAKLHQIRLGWRYRLGRLVALLACVYGIVVFGQLLMRNEFTAAIYAGVGSTLLCLIAVMGSRRNMRQVIRKQMENSFGEPYIQRFGATSQHLLISNRLAESKVRWTAFRKWFEADGVVVATVHDGMHFFIPVAQLDPALADTIRQRITQHAADA